MSRLFSLIVIVQSLGAVIKKIIMTTDEQGEPQVIKDPIPISKIASQKSTTTASQTERSPVRRKGKCYAIHSVGVKIWIKKEWLCFLLLLLLGSYAIGGLAGNAVNLRSLEKIKLSTEPKPSTQIICVLMAAQAVLLVGVIFGLMCLFIRRDLIGFILTFLFLIAALVILSYLAGYGTYVIVTDKPLMSKLYNFVKAEINHNRYRFEFHAFEQENKCCGVRDWKDYKSFGPLEKLAKGAVPESCCLDKFQGLNSTTCALKVLTKKKDALKDILNTKGCGPIMIKKYRRFYLRALIEAVVVILIILIVLIILLKLLCRWWKAKRKNPSKEWIDPREQEDDNESLVIPGTPKKSIDDLEDGSFYAP